MKLSSKNGFGLTEMGQKCETVVEKRFRAQRARSGRATGRRSPGTPVSQKCETVVKKGFGAQRDGSGGAAGRQPPGPPVAASRETRIIHY